MLSQNCQLWYRYFPLGSILWEAVELERIGRSRRHIFTTVLLLLDRSEVEGD